MKTIKNIINAVAVTIVLLVSSFLFLVLADGLRDPIIKTSEDVIVVDEITIHKITKSNGSVSFISTLDYDIEEFKALALGFAVYEIYPIVITYTIDCKTIGYLISIANNLEGSVLKVPLNES